MVDPILGVVVIPRGELCGSEKVLRLSGSNLGGGVESGGDEVSEVGRWEAIDLERGGGVLLCCRGWGWFGELFGGCFYDGRLGLELPFEGGDLGVLKFEVGDFGLEIEE